MTGMKVATVCKPPPMPLARMTVSHSGDPSPPSTSAKPSTSNASAALSKKSMKAPPMLMVNMNIRYIISKKIGMPSRRLSTTRSIRSVMSRSTRPVTVTLALAILLAKL